MFILLLYNLGYNIIIYYNSMFILHYEENYFSVIFLLNIHIHFYKKLIKKKKWQNTTN